MHFRREYKSVQKIGRRSDRSSPGLVLPVFLIYFLLLVFLMALPASAQTASFRLVDTNSDRVLSFDELVAAFGRDGAIRLLRSTDHNGDGRVTILELRRGADGERDDRARPGFSDERDDDRDEDRGDDDGGDDDGDDGGDD